MSSGQKAAKWGNWLENTIAEILDDEYELVAAKEFHDLRKEKEPIYAKQCTIGKNIYGQKRRVDLILYHPNRWPKCLVIECKSQSSPGSVDQKYPFEVMSINCNKYKTIIVLSGDGFRKEAKDWLKAQTGKGKLLHVMDIGEIRRFQTKGKL